MRRALISLSDLLHRIVRRATLVTVALMFVTVMVQVVARYILFSPPVWTEDVARYAMVWTGLLGATLSFKTRADAVLMQSVFPPAPHLLGHLARALESLAVLAFVLPVLYFSVFDFRGSTARGYLMRQAGITMDTLGIPMVWISAMVPLSLLIILIHLIARWAGDDAAAALSEERAALLD